MIAPFLIWVGSCLLFIFAVVSQIETLVYFNLLFVLIGIAGFIWYLYKFGKKYGAFKTFLIALLLIVIFSTIFVVSINPSILNNINFNSINQNNNQQGELIECYVDGKRIMATRNDCQELSIPEPQPTQAPVIIQQQAPARQPIQYNPIKNTRCFWIGDTMHCTTY